MAKKTLFAGIDAGLWSTKTVLLNGGEPVERMWPTKLGNYYAPAVIPSGKEALMSQRLVSPALSYGELAEYGGNVLTPPRKPCWLYSPLHIDVIISALHAVGLRNGDVVDVCFSVPYSWHKHHKEKLKTFLGAQTWQFTTLDNKEHTITVNNVYVTPQGLGIFLTDTFHRSGTLRNPSNLQSLVVVLDIGSGTTNVITLKNGMEMSGNSDTLQDRGSWFAVHALQRLLNTQFRVGIDEETAREAYLTGVYKHEGRQDVSGLIDTANQELYRVLLSDVEKLVDLESVDKILVGGGTSESLFAQIHAAHEAIAVQSSAPRMANANGNAIFARNKSAGGK